MANGHPDHWQPQYGGGHPGHPGHQSQPTGYGPPPGYGPPQGYGPPPGYGHPGPGGMNQHMMYDAQKKSVGVAYLLWAFLGGVGAHRFYLGQTATGAVMLGLMLVGIITAILIVGFLLLIPLWIWVIVDAFLIPGMARDYNMRLAQRFSY